MTFDRSPRRRCALQASFRPRLEHLEDRAVPATFNVTTTLDNLIGGDGKLTLREALVKANIQAGVDTIILPSGVFKITLAGSGDDNNATGDLDIIDTVTIQGAGAGATVIDGQQLDRVFDVLGSGPSPIKVVFNDLTIRNGNVATHGGGIQVSNADLVLRDSVVTRNRVSLTGGGISAPGTGNVTLVDATVSRNVSGIDGGGVYVGTGTLTLKESSVRRNAAGNSSFGGGINAKTATLTNSTVSGNSAVNGGGIWANTTTLTGSTVIGNFAGIGGGGIYAVTTNLTGSTVSGNFASSGGAIKANTLVMSNSTISANTASQFGGGLDVGVATVTGSTISGNSAGINGGGLLATTVTLTNSTINGNIASGNGGGALATTATLTNSTVSGNIAGGNGGGINAATGNLTNSTVSGNSAANGNGGGVWASLGALLNCTIAENTALTGGGLFHDISTGNQAFTVQNTIVALNVVRFTGTGPDVSGPFSSLGHDLIGDSTGGTGFIDGSNGDIVGSSVNSIDPKLGQLQNNGGPTKTMALQSGSPAIDHGDNGIALTTDQRRLPREKDGNFDGVAVVDIGAFER